MNTVLEEPTPAISQTTVALPPDWFDAGFYLENNPGVAGDAASAWTHFRDHGWRKFRNPSPGFDVWWYQAWHLGADPCADPVAHYEAQVQKDGLATTLLPGERLDVSRKTAFNRMTLKLFRALEPGAGAAVFARVASNLARMEQWDLADMFAVKACAVDANRFEYQILLANILQKRGGSRRAIEPLRRAIALEGGRPEWLHDLGRACERLGWLDQALEAYEQALAMEPNRFDTLYRLGMAHASSGRADEAAAIYARLESLDPEVAVLGVGIVHQRNGDWVGARDAYAARLVRGPGNAHLHFAHGFALEMMLYWEEAATAYANALALDGTNAEWHYRHGHVLERLERHPEAVTAYTAAVAARDIADWRYRLASCMAASGHLAGAVDLWLRDIPDAGQLVPSVAPEALAERKAALRKALSSWIHDPDRHFELGLVHERLGEFREAADAYRQAILRRSDLQPHDHLRLGAVLSRLGDLQGAAAACAGSRLYRRDFSHLPPPQSADIKFEYAEFLDTLAVDPGIILYECNQGHSINCNPYAIFRKARERFAGQGMLHVWVVRDTTSIPAELATPADVVLVRHGSTNYVRYLASAGWLVNNTTFPPYFFRRPEQRYLNTWHGTPIKSLGRDVRGSLFDYKNVSRNLLQVTHLAVQNRHSHETLLRSNDVAGLFTGRVAETGHARIDPLVSSDAQARLAIRRRLGVEPGMPVVLYAPTYRGQVHSPSFDLEALHQAIGRIGRHPAALMFNAHPFVARQIEGRLPAGVLGVPAGMDITELLSVVDVLVTDYSSILFDFLPTGRPAVLYTPDLELYRRERGMYLELETLPAAVCRGLDELDRAVSAALASAAGNADSPLLPGREQALATYCPNDDGRAAERAVRFFFDGASDWDVDVRPPAKSRLLFHPGNFNTNGITASFSRLVAQLDPDRFHSTVVVDPWNLESYPQRLDRYAELPGHVGRLPRISYPVCTLEESWLASRLGTEMVAGTRAQAMLDRYFIREYRRLFGEARFDAVIDFAGYTLFWTALFARGRPQDARAVVYLHNDMKQETTTRLPSLSKIFDQYRYCDTLVSVSETLDRINTAGLAAYVDPSRTTFTHAENCIDPEHIRRLSAAPLPEGLEQWRQGCVLLGTVGRLSPEKGHARLLEAFARLHAQTPTLRLLVVGDGAERLPLQQQAVRLGIADAVRFTGTLENPYPVMKSLDLFVLPSFYEGQAIVLLEALTLGTATLSTDIPGPRNVLANGAGILVENSTEGLVGGIERWLEARPKAPAWDAHAYRERTVAQFMAILSGGSGQ